MGLALWSADPLTLSAVTTALGRRRPRHTITITAAVAEAAGMEVSGPGPVTVPALALAPQAMVAALIGPDRPALGAVGGDIEFLAGLASAVTAWVDAGAVVPQLREIDGYWLPHWVLLGTRAQRRWRAEQLAAMPAAAAGPGTDPAAVLDEAIGAIAEAIIGSRTAAAADDPDPLIAALAAGTGFDPEPGAAIAAELERWHAGLRAAEPVLVLVLDEPVGPIDLDGGGEQIDEPLWRLRLCARDERGGPAPIDPVRTDPQVTAQVLAEFATATEIYPLLARLPQDDDGLGLWLPTAAVTDLIAHGARALTEAGVTVLLPRVMRLADPELTVTVRPADKDDCGGEVDGEPALGLERLMEFDLRLAVGDTELGIAEVRELIDVGTGLVRLREGWVLADDATLQAAARYLAAQAGEPATLARLITMVSTDPPPVPIAAVHAEGWVRPFLEARPATDGPDVPGGLRARLRPYQLDGYRWLSFMAEHRLGAILADDMGLGKTVQLLALLEHRRTKPGRTGPALVVCPTSVVGNWQREAERFTPGLRRYVHHGPGRLRGAELTAQLGRVDLVITTYGLLARDIDDLSAHRYENLILDEAQQVKNPRTAQARAARRIDARHIVAATGTPVENRLGELWAIMDLVNPGLLGSRTRFRAAIETPIADRADPDAIARLRAVTGPFVLRRMKTDPAVAADLPDKHETTERVHLTAEQAGLYQAVLDDLRDKLSGARGIARKGAVLTALMHLKQVCNHPAHYLGDGSAVLRGGQHRSGKLALVDELVEQIVGGGERVLLFTQFRAFGDLIVPWLSDRFTGEPVPFLHGGTPRAARDDMVARFQAGQGPPIMVLSVLAGGTGITLTAANHVIHLDRWWNPAVEAQATDRAYRIGQRRDVQVHRLMAVETVEERIDALLADKRRLAELTVAVGEEWITELDDERLAALLALGDAAVAG